MRLFRNTRSLITALLVLLIPAAAMLGAIYFVQTAPRGGAQSGRVPARITQTSTQVSNQDISAGSTLDVPAPDFKLRDQQNRPVSLQQFRGKVVVLAFIDSHCTTICPLTTQSMLDALQLLGHAAKRVQLIGINSNPDATDIADVAAYTEAHRLQGRWEFLTGSLRQLKKVWHDYHVYVAAMRNDIDHEPVFYLIGPAGHERVLYVTQMSYEGVAQQAQILADGIANLLPSHPAVPRKVPLQYVQPLTPSDTAKLTGTDSKPVILGPHHPRLIMFFADWLSEDTDVSANLAALGHYKRVARQHHWPAPLVIDEQTTESSAGTDRVLMRFAAAAHIPVVRDTGGRLADGYGVQDLPWFTLTSKSGQIIWQHDGWLSATDLVHQTGAALSNH